MLHKKSLYVAFNMLYLKLKNQIENSSPDNELQWRNKINSRSTAHSLTFVTSSTLKVFKRMMLYMYHYKTKLNLNKVITTKKLRDKKNFMV